MVYQSIFFSEHIFFSFSSDDFTYQLDFFHIRQLELWIFWQLPLCFRVSTYVLSILWILNLL